MEDKKIKDAKLKDDKLKDVNGGTIEDPTDNIVTYDIPTDTSSDPAGMRIRGAIQNRDARPY